MKVSLQLPHWLGGKVPAWCHGKHGVTVTWWQLHVALSCSTADSAEAQKFEPDLSQAAAIMFPHL